MGFRMVSKSFTLNDHERRKVMTADARYLCGNRASRCGWATKNGQVYASVHPSVRLFNRATTAVCPEKKEQNVFFVISSIKLGRFWWNLVYRFLKKLTTKSYKRVSLLLNNVSTLPCETWNAHQTRATVEL